MSLSRRQLSRVGAPAAFLLGVTIAVLLVRAGLGGPAPAPATVGGVTRSSGTAASRPATTAAVSRETTRAATTARSGSPPADRAYYTVQRGDTFYSIASQEGTSVSQLEALNPGVSPNSLTIGERIRVR